MAWVQSGACHIWKRCAARLAHPNRFLTPRRYTPLAPHTTAPSRSAQLNLHTSPLSANAPLASDNKGTPDHELSWLSSRNTKGNANVTLRERNNDAGETHVMTYGAA